MGKRETRKLLDCGRAPVIPQPSFDLVKGHWVDERWGALTDGHTSQKIYDGKIYICKIVMGENFLPSFTVTVEGNTYSGVNITAVVDEACDAVSGKKASSNKVVDFFCLDRSAEDRVGKEPVCDPGVSRKRKADSDISFSDLILPPLNPSEPLSEKKTIRFSLSQVRNLETLANVFGCDGDIAM
jgi:hypothetical protein